MKGEKREELRKERSDEKRKYKRIGGRRKK
jgi:hypothetical protein